MATDRVSPLRGSSFHSFDEAVLQAIASALPTPGETPHRFNVLQLSIQVGGFVGRPQFIADVAEVVAPNV